MNFAKMAHGDPAGLIEMAFDYFNETRRLMTGWMALIESKNYGQLRDDLHRCKGGASLFGLERLVSLLGEFESPAVLEQRGFDLATFENELTAAEKAVAGMAQAVN
ncbi:MAG: Hpt domain-containing protein [Luteolibacter sp.]|nr:Hpt domain-containing protein [Luteolibacter sp.]